MNINDLSQRTKTPVRQIRYLIAEGFVPAPCGGRSTAFYEEDHLQAVHRYNKLKALGFTPNTIRILLERDEAISIPVAKGVALSINPSLVGNVNVTDALLRKVERVLKRVSKGERKWNGEVEKS